MESSDHDENIRSECKTEGQFTLGNILRLMHASDRYTEDFYKSCHRHQVESSRETDTQPRYRTVQTTNEPEMMISCDTEWDRMVKLDKKLESPTTLNNHHHQQTFNFQHANTPSLMYETEETLVREHGFPVATTWGGRWDYSHHTGYEDKAHKFQLLLHHHTDIFMRVIWLFSLNGRVVPLDIHDKLKTYYIPDTVDNGSQIVELVSDFLREPGIRSHMEAFSTYTLTQGNTYTFAILVYAARSLVHLGGGDFHNAFVNLSIFTDYLRTNNIFSKTHNKLKHKQKQKQKHKRKRKHKHKLKQEQKQKTKV
jgi:hypothetical protein